MTISNSKTWLQTGIELPSAYGENTAVAQRGSMRGDGFVQNIAKGRVPLAEEGSYFLATNPTPGTGIAGIAAADGYDATEALITIRNGGTASATAKRVILDYIKLQPTVAGASGTNCTYATHVDKGNTRWSSGGTAYTPINLNRGSDVTANAVIHFGALVTDAATADVQKLQSGNLRTAVVVVGDEMYFDFGGEMQAGASGLFEGTLVCKQVVKHVPVVLNPQEEFILCINAASQAVTGSSFEFEIGFSER